MIPSENIMPIAFVIVAVLCGPVALAVYMAKLEIDWRRWRRTNLG